MQGTRRLNDARALPDLPPNTVLSDRYEVMDRLGAGAYAAVYHAWDHKLEMEKAIKVFPAGLSEEEKEALRAEARAQARLNHPNVVRLFDFDDTGDYPLLDLEYVEGENLRTLLDKGRLSRKRAMQMAVQTAEGLLAAHNADILHRDLKPENILVGLDGVARITDFGVADDLRRSVARPNSGTTAYRAPELREGIQPGKSTDIFSFGVTLYEMLYGEHPFPDENDRRSYELPDHLLRSKKPVDGILRRCLSPAPEHRFPSAVELVHELNALNEKGGGGGGKSVMQVFYRLNPMRGAPPEIRRELTILVVLLILMAVLIPFYLRTLKQVAEPVSTITFDGAPLAVFVNMAPRSNVPLNELKRGDLLQFRDQLGNPLFSYVYQGENPFVLRYSPGSIWVNNELRGKRVRTRQDLPLPPNLAYLATEIPLEAGDLAEQHHPNLCMRLGRMVPPRAWEALPPQTSFLDIGGSRTVSSLAGLHHFTRLRGLDASGIDDLYMQGLTVSDSLSLLNVSATGLRSVAPLADLRSLRHLNIARNNLSDLNGLNRLENLESVDVSYNHGELEDIGPLLELPNLVQIARGGTTLGDSTQAALLRTRLDSLATRHGRVVERREYRARTIADKLVFALAAALLLAVAWTLARVLLLQLPKPGEPQANLSREIRSITREMEAGRLYAPPQNNAAEHLAALQKEHPGHIGLRRTQDRLVRNIQSRMKEHTRRGEPEPAWLMARDALAVLDDSRLALARRSVYEDLVKNDDLITVRIPAGSYQMGDFAEGSLTNATPAHTVEISQFHLTRTAITNGQFCRFLNAMGRHREGFAEWINIDSPYCRIERVDNRYRVREPYTCFPVYEVSWLGAVRFCEWSGGRLPTEAEWEYAARAGGQNVLYATGNRVNKKLANYLLNAEDGRWHSVVPVRSFKPNALGLFEMSGNVLEWCADWYDAHYYEHSPERDPRGPETGTLRVVRGGAWCFPVHHMRTYYRGSANPTSRTNFIGFRMARDH